VEVERSLWGKHPDPNQAWIEDQLFSLGHRYLHDLMAFVLGARVQEFAKAEAPMKPPHWGEVMALFNNPAPPAQKLATWSSLLDGFTAALIPPTSAQSQVAMWALRSALLNQIAQRVHAVTTPGAWDAMFHTLPPAQKLQVEWSQVHGGQFVTNMTAKARAVVLDALVDSQMAHGNHHTLARVLHEKLGTLNRDWRRIAITETGMAVASGQLQTALSAGGDWEAVWVAGPRACPFCQGQNGRVLRVVPADHPSPDGATMIWPGKTNVGRSASLHRKDGTKRGPDELWWPCLPAHPNCACVWTLRRVVKSAAAKKAQDALAALRAKRYATAVS
jgi:hypothetical protein